MGMGRLCDELAHVRLLGWAWELSRRSKRCAAGPMVLDEFHEVCLYVDWR